MLFFQWAVRIGKELSDMFESNREQNEMIETLEGWIDDPQNMKGVFIRLKDKFTSKKGAIFSFKTRPGVSYSLRANVGKAEGKDRPLFALMDIVDDQTASRWLSVCFYSDLVTDPDEEGNLVPAGILGVDGYCFDLFEYDKELVLYIEQRIDEAYSNALEQ